MIYRPDIKPPMWGPPEAVHYAVRHNAERMGIPAPKIVIPLFEAAGAPFEVMQQIQGAVPSFGSKLPEWSNRDLVFEDNVGDGVHFGDVANYLSSINAFCVGSFSSFGDSRTLLNKGSGGQGYHQWDLKYHGSPQALRVSLRSASGQTNIDGATRPDLGVKHTMSFGWDDTDNVCNIYLNGSLDGTGSFSGPIQSENNVLSLGLLDNYGGSGEHHGSISVSYVFDVRLNTKQQELLHETPYALLMPVARPFIFDMGAGGGTVNSNFAIQFGINNLIESDFQAVYDVLNLVNSSFVISYDIFNLTNSDFQTLFDIAGKASSDLQIVYDISGNRVPSDFVVTYDVLEKVNSEMVITFDLLNSVFSDFAPVYDIRQLVNSDFEIVFDLNNLVGSDFTILYDMAGRTFSDFTVRFDLGDVPVVVVRGSGIGLKIGIGI